MEISRDSQRASVSVVNGLPRRRQRITTLRTDQDRHVELQETVRLGGAGDFPKRGRIDRSSVQQKSDGGESYRESSTGMSDEESYEEEEEVRVHRTNQSSPASSDLSINRRGLRKLRSSPVHRAAADEMFGVPVPRRARSSSAKRLHEYCSSGSGGFSEDLSHRRFSQSSVSLVASGDSMKKMRSLERKTTPISNPPKLSAIQDDIEIEVAEALFDLMKQSQPQTSQKREKVESDKVIPASHEVKKSKADVGEGENNAFSVQNEPPIKVNAEIVLADSRKERKKEGTVEREKFSDEHAQDLVSGDGFVNKEKVGPPRESESPSCVVNASDTQDPTVTKAHYDAIIVEARKESKLEIDLMASPLPSSPEIVETDTGVVTEAVRKKSEIISKNGPGVVAKGMQKDIEKQSHDTTQQQQVRKEYTNQSPTSLLPSHFGLSSWPGGVLPHPGYMHPLLAVTPVYGSAKSPMIMQPPQFKLSASRPKRCATQQYLAESIHCHQQLIKNSLSTAPAALSRAESPNPKCMSPTQNLSPVLGDFLGGQNMATASVGSGKDKSCDAAVALNATASSKSLLQQALYPAPTSRFLPGHGFILPFNHHQAAVMAPANSSGSPQSASKLSNSAVSLNVPMFHSDEAAPYMAMLQNNSCSIPNISIPTFKGRPPSIAFFNPSLYPSLPFNQNQQQLTPSHASVQSASQNSNLSSHKQPQSLQQTGSISQSEKPGLRPSPLSSKSDTESSWKNGARPRNLQTHSLPSQPMNFAVIPTVSRDGGAGNKQTDPPQQGSKSFAFSYASNASATPSMAQNSGMFQMLPDMSRNGNQMMYHEASEGKSLASGGQSFNYSKSDGSEISALPTMGIPKFDGLARNINFLPSSLAGSLPFQTSAAALSSGFQQHKLIQVQDHHLHLAGKGQVKSSAPPSIPGSFFHPKWENFPRNTTPEGSPQLKTSSQGGHTQINFGHGPVSASSYQGHQFAIKTESMSLRPSSNSSLSKSGQRNAFDVGLAVSTASALASQEAEASQGQKSSPACRRNVPSFLSSSPSQLPELKH